jgi:hypothetical protein
MIAMFVRNAMKSTREVRAQGTWALAAALVLAPMSPGAAQRHTEGPQLRAENPFRALHAPRFSMDFGGGGAIGNNVVDIGDAVAIMKLLEQDNGPTLGDLLLITGVLPNGDSRIAGSARAGTSLTIPTPWLQLGFDLQGRALARATIPADLNTLMREGSNAELVELDLSDFRVRGASFADLALRGLADVLSPHPDVALKIGAGIHYLKLIAAVDMGMVADEHGRHGMISMGHDGIDADILFQAPAEPEILAGGGYALDLYASAVVRDRYRVRALLADVGAISSSPGTVEQMRVVGQGMSVGDFIDLLDATEPVELHDQVIRMRLPARLRLEGDMDLPYRLNVEVFQQILLSGAIASLAESSATGVMVHWSGASFLPLRLGLRSHYGYGLAVHGGWTLRAGPLQLEADVVNHGGLRLDRTRGVSARISSRLRF